MKQDFHRFRIVVKKALVKWVYDITWRIHNDRENHICVSLSPDHRNSIDREWPRFKLFKQARSLPSRHFIQRLPLFAMPIFIVTTNLPRDRVSPELGGELSRVLAEALNKPLKVTILEHIQHISTPYIHLTHCDPVTPYGDIELGQYWVRYA